MRVPVPDRMPVIRDGDAIRRRLAKDSSAEALTSLLRPCHDAELNRNPFAALVGSPKNDVPQCIVPLAGKLAKDGE